MAPTTALRCLAITVVIGLATIEPHASAFTIQHPPDLLFSGTTHNNTIVINPNATNINTTKIDDHVNLVASDKISATDPELAISPLQHVNVSVTNDSYENAATVNTSTENISSPQNDKDKTNPQYIQNTKEDVHINTTDAYYVTGTDIAYSLFPVQQKIENTTNQTEDRVSFSSADTAITTPDAEIVKTPTFIQRTGISKSSKSPSTVGYFRGSDVYYTRLNSRELIENPREYQKTTPFQVNHDTETVPMNYNHGDGKSATDSFESLQTTTNKIPLTSRPDILMQDSFGEFIDSELRKTEGTPYSYTATPLIIRYNKNDSESAATDYAEATTDFSTEMMNNRERMGVMSSQRAGFLNYSPNTNSKLNKFTIEGNTDATEDELSKSSTMADNRNRYSNDTYKSSVKNIWNEYNNMESTTDHESFYTKPAGEWRNKVTSNDVLSVKPISDKSKAAIYTVSPQYKPLKKIEVQPQRHFLRDPDDNSWRNESLSSLGIVFRAKNSSKTFTEVLKNKTEAELNALGEKLFKGQPELRARLEKIAEQRKSKKKRPNSTGCDESTSDCYFASLVESGRVKDMDSSEEQGESEEDYVQLANIDIKKYLNPPPKTRPMQQYPVINHVQNPPAPPKKTESVWPERKPTVQYFPPLFTHDVNVNDYDANFVSKVNLFTPRSTLPTTSMAPLQTYPALDDYVSEIEKNKFQNRLTVIPNSKSTSPTPAIVKENHKIFVTSNPNIHYAILNTDESFDKASYIIKHLKELLTLGTKTDLNNNVYTEAENLIPEKNGELNNNIKTSDVDSYPSYMGLEPYMDNDNRNNARFSGNYPLLYNTSVIHTKGGRGYASSSAVLRRQYDKERKRSHGKVEPSSYDVAPSPVIGGETGVAPDYDGHYYVPDAEQTQEMEIKSEILPPYMYRFRK